MNTFDKYEETLINEAKKLHDLTITTIEFCGGTYEQHLDGATSYFMVGDERFKIELTKC